MKTIKFKLHVAWWWYSLYVPVIRAMCFVTGRQPNMDSLEYWADKAITVTQVSAE